MAHGISAPEKLDKKEREREDGSDDRSGRQVQDKGKNKAEQTADKSHDGGEQHHARQGVDKRHGDGLRDGEDGENENDTDRLDGQRDGQRHKDGRHRGDQRRAPTCKTRVDRVERRVEERAVENDGAKDDDKSRDGIGHDIGQAYSQKVAKHEAHQVGSVTRRQAKEDDPDGHAKAPKHGDGAVMPDASAARRPIDAKRRDDGENKRPESGVQAKEIRKTDATETGVSDAPRRKDHTSGDYVRPDDTTYHR